LFFFGSEYCGDMGQDLYEQSINGEDVDFADLADVMGNIVTTTMEYHNPVLLKESVDGFEYQT
jgi:hypothetical protein